MTNQRERTYRPTDDTQPKCDGQPQTPPKDKDKYKYRPVKPLPGQLPLIPDLEGDPVIQPPHILPKAITRAVESVEVRLPRQPDLFDT